MDRNKLVEELIKDEGYKYEIYLDHLGYPTFGVGHLVLETDEEYGQPVGTPVSEERILECLNNDIDIVCKELDKNMGWWSDLDDTRQRVLANMAFNLGATRLAKFVNFKNMLSQGKWKEAAVEGRDSLWYRQVTNRAERLMRRLENI